MRSFIIILALISTVSAINVTTEVNDPDLSGTATASHLSGNGGSFFIANGGAPITGPGSIVGWYYTPGSPLLEVIDNELSGSARPSLPVTDPTGHFFIMNNRYIGESGGVVGWYYTPGSPILEVIDSNSMADGAYSNFVAVSENGTFFIANGLGFSSSTSNGLIGWLYTPGLAIVEITDPLMPPDTVNPNAVAAGISGDFFITNQNGISSPGAVIGWYYTTGTTAAEVTDTSLGQSAETGEIAANGAGNFFIANFNNPMGDNLVGWYYVAGDSTATEVPDPLLTSTSTYPYSVASDTNNGFFIANNFPFSPGIGQSFPLVGWYFAPGDSNAQEVKDLALTGSASPGYLAGSGSQYFISNSNDELVGSDQLIGWEYTLGSMNAVEVTDPATIASDVDPASVAANSSGNFFIVNGNDFIGANQIIGWYYVPGSPLVEAIDSGSVPIDTFGGEVAPNGAGDFFISNGNAINGAAPLVGWYYGPPISSSQRSFKRPNNRR